MIKIEYNLAPNICKPCGGKCCKYMPGAAMPSDFPTEEARQKALDSGRWCIDWWEGDPRKDKDELSTAEYIRPAIKGYEGQKYHGSWGGECTFLTLTGCELKPSKRPAECLGLKPVKSTKCIGDPTRDKKAAAIAWIGIIKKEE